MISHIDVTAIDAVKTGLKSLGKDAPHAIRIAISEIGESGQRGIRASLPKHFALRGTKTAFDRAVIWRKPKATGKHPQGELAVGTEGKQTATSKLGALLARHEEGGSRASSKQVYFDSRGREMTGLGFFLPAKGRRTAQANPPRSEYPAAIGAVLRAQKRKGKEDRLILAKGTKKGTKTTIHGATYFATRKGIFRRRHSAFGRAKPELLWYFKKTVRTPPRLRMVETVDAVIAKVGTDAMLRAIDTVIRRSM